MHRKLLICVFLVAVLVEPSYSILECLDNIVTFMNNLKGNLENLVGSIPKTNYSFGMVLVCTVPEPPNGARIVGASPEQIVFPAFRLTYSCTDGYTMSGSEISICSDGVWHNTPTCLPSQTAEPPLAVDYTLIDPRFRDE